MDDKLMTNGWQIWQVDGKYGKWMANGRQWMTNGGQTEDKWMTNGGQIWHKGVKRKTEKEERRKKTNEDKLENDRQKEKME